MMIKQAKLRSPLLYFFIGFFIFLIFLEGMLLYIASTSYTGIVTEEAYRKGLKYNDEVLKKSKQQAALGWQEELKVMQHNNQVEIWLSLQDKDEKAITSATVEGKIIRPVTNQYDITLDFQEIKSGIYKAVADLPLHGKWEIKLRIHHGSAEFFISKVIIINF